MRYLSLFSGVEAATVAWEPLGWEAVAFAEIEPFPSAVLAHHWPDVPNLGDVSGINEEMLRELGHIDLVVGGSPCQDLSVAGKGKGLAGERSGLFHEQIRIFHLCRKLYGTRYLLWENVPGAITSNKGRDFTTVVAELAGLDDITTPKYGWGKEGAAVGDHGLLEWCCLDAQWFGLAQRRKRVFALLDTGDCTSRPPILLERESVRGGPPTVRETQQGIAGVAQEGFRMLSFGNYRSDETASTIKRRDYKGYTDLVVTEHGVRRYTPMEHVLLQGLPARHLLGASDKDIYQATGNSMAVNVMRYIGEQINLHG